MLKIRKTQSLCHPLQKEEDIVMQALRLIREIENGTLKIDLPEPFKKGKIEIIIMNIEENERTRDTFHDFDPEQFRGIWKHLNLDVGKMCGEMREEWNQRF